MTVYELDDGYIADTSSALNHWEVATCWNGRDNISKIVETWDAVSSENR
jgi:hypothetical protein